MRKNKDQYVPIHREAAKFQEFCDLVQSDMQDKCETESHFIKTNDGYILQTFRVKLKEKYRNDLKDKSFVDQPVLMFHSFMASSVLVYPHNAKYFIGKGCDVWLSNTRGNRFSMYHTDKNINEKDFFNFCIDDYACDVKC